MSLIRIREDTAYQEPEELYGASRPMEIVVLEGQLSEGRKRDRLALCVSTMPRTSVVEQAYVYESSIGNLRCYCHDEQNAVLLVLAVCQT